MVAFNHACFIASDVEETKKLWIDLLGFRVMVQKIIPDEGDTPFCFTQEQLDAIFHVKNSKSMMVLLINDKGTVIELQQPLNPPPKKTPRDELMYLNTGTHEFALTVDNVDEWFDKVRAAGYETTTPNTWLAPLLNCKSFLFYDPDDNMIQFVEMLGKKA